MNVKNVINLLSVILNVLLFFPLVSQGTLTVLYGIKLQKEAFFDYYSEMFVILPVSTASIVLFGVIIPFIFSQLAAIVSLRLLYSYITKPNRNE
jgi:hypothetical protein